MTVPAEDTDALRALSAEYAAVVDARDGESFAALFVDGGELLVPGDRANGYQLISRRGHEALRSVPDGLRRFERTFHLVSNHRFAIDGDWATGDVDCVAHHVSAAAGPVGTGGDSATDNPAGTGGGAAGTDTVWFVHYRDDYVRTPVGWRFQRRTLHLRWVEEHPVSVLPEVSGGPTAG